MNNNRKIFKHIKINKKHLLINILNIFYIIIIIYLIYVNIWPFIMKVKYNFILDVGSNQENSVKGIDAFPLNSRISEAISGNPSYRELKDPLVYTSIRIPQNSKKMELSVRFKDNFPKESKFFFIGAKDKDVWSYKYQPIYLPEIKIPKNKLNISDGLRKLYFLNDNTKKFSSIKEFLDNIPEGSLIATNVPIKQKSIIIKNYIPGKLKIITALRGSHSFYVYAAGSLELVITKQDLNAYEGEDALTVTVYDKNDKIINESIIPDDGISDKSNKRTEPQTAIIRISNIAEGVYRIELKNNADMIIKKIFINQDKFVVYKNIFLAANEGEKIKIVPSKIYIMPYRETNVQMKVWHKEAFQEINVGNKIINITETNKKYIIVLKARNELVEVRSNTNNIMINSDGYFSFTKNSYFNPMQYQTTDISNFSKADYLFIDYKEPEKDDGWLIGTTVFDLTDLYIKDDKLSIILSAKHLGDKKYKDYTIPIDWVKATVFSFP